MGFRFGGQFVIHLGFRSVSYNCSGISIVKAYFLMKVWFGPFLLSVHLCFLLGYEILLQLRVDDILIRGLKWGKLLDPDKKGLWWLSGDIVSNAENVEEVADTIDKDVPETQKMLQLASAQRMNTDARRAIFCIIMSGEDYIDAFEKLIGLDLQGKQVSIFCCRHLFHLLQWLLVYSLFLLQDREIMRVLVECCLQEKAFNKYYCILASKLCSHDKNHKFTLQVLIITC